MKAKELRIGNYVNYICIAMDINEPIYRIENGADIQVHQNHNLFKPIPLTEQWLKDFGFKKCNRTNFKACYETKNKKYIFQFAQNGLLVLIDCGNFFEIITAVEYVHQLQNFYFVLTGNELTKQ